MSNYYAKYIEALQKHEHWTKLKEDRIKFLEEYYRARGKGEWTTEVLVDRDYEVKLYAGKAARWATQAAAYGPAALIEFQQIQMRNQSA